MTRATKVHLLLWPCAFFVGLAGSLIALREPTEPLTQENLEIARTRWQRTAIADYDLRYRMHGSEYEITVRGGWVVGAKVNGLTPANADLQSYSMNGLFTLLEQELDQPMSSTGSNGSALRRVRFHPELGFVERYLRSGSGTARGAGVEVHELRVIPGSTAGSQPSN